VHGVRPSHLRCLPRFFQVVPRLARHVISSSGIIQLTQARHAAGTEGGGTACDMRASVVAERPRVADEVAVPGLSLDTAGEPLLEAADECGASGENDSISATSNVNPAPSERRWAVKDNDGRGELNRDGKNGGLAICPSLPSATNTQMQVSSRTTHTSGVPSSEVRR